jgi:Chaperone of endosialidase
MKSQNLILLLILAICVGLSSQMQAVVPAPDGGYPGGNTAEGQQALLTLTTGSYNTAVGYLSLRSNTTGKFNTAFGAGTLLVNMAARNTATGAGALLNNTTGSNTANGAFALFSNTTGYFNTAVGGGALLNNTEGSVNTAIGDSALLNNTTGINNTASGRSALHGNTTGHDNAADGVVALFNNTTGSNNIALGSMAGQNLTTGDYNIDIGNAGVAGEANTIRIGDDNQQGAAYIGGVYSRSVAGLEVVMDASTRLGTLASSRRFKNEIRAMDKASEAILALKPVTFRYKKEIDPQGIPQFGLVAEDVEKVNPDLVVRDKQGKPYSVRYNAVNAMLLNEFLKEHHRVEEQQATITQLKSAAAKQDVTISELKAGLGILAAQLKEQAAEIQKVSALVELSKSATKLADTKQ